MAAWTDRDLPDLSGRVALVTGANSGIGFRTALALAGHGARVLLGCRDTARGSAALDRLLLAAPSASAELLPVDLADLASVESASAVVASRVEALDLLVNNAGVMALPPRLSADGYELQFATNHLGHFALTGRLLPLLLAVPNARVVTVSSGAHRMGRIDFDNLQGEHGYSPWRAYGQSKLANLLFTAELGRRADVAGRPLLAVAAHPGYAATGLQERGPAMSGSRVGVLGMKALNAVLGQSDAAGAWPSLYAATMPDVRQGDYIGPGGAFEWRGHPGRAARSAAARDADTAFRLWRESERLTGVTYDWAAGAGDSRRS